MSTAVFLALARDCQNRMPLNLEVIAATGYTHFSSWRCFVYENDSTDDTPNILADVASKDGRFAFASERAGTDRLLGVPTEDRAAKMAFLRNKLLENFRAAPADYMVVFDADIIRIPPPVEFSSMLYGNAWDYVGSAGIESRLPLMQYDTWAFLHHPTDTFREDIYLPLPRPKGIFPVGACFGGVAVINGKSILSTPEAAYSPSRGCCEHAGLCSHFERVGLNTDYQPIR